MARGPRACGLVVDGGAGVVRPVVILGLMLIAIAGCSSSPPSPPGTYKLGQPYQIAGRWYYPEYDPDYDRVGVASWYGEPFHGRATANGEVFDRGTVTAAHPTLPLPSLVRVTNLDNGREMTIRVNDRGPFVGDRIIDLSQQAARQLGFEEQGLAPVRVRFVSLADARGTPPSPTLPRAPVAVADRGRAAPPLALSSAQVAAAGPPPIRALADGGREAQPAVPSPAQVAAAAPPPVQALAEAPARCHGQFIQVGAFAEPARAQRMVAELHALEAMPVSLAAPAEDRLARVRLGPIPDPASASAALERLKRFGIAGAFIVVPAEELPTPC
jgi:rare lipoprotein A